jgi:hypothetical protein
LSALWTLTAILLNNRKLRFIAATLGDVHRAFAALAAACLLPRILTNSQTLRCGANEI